MKLEYEEGARYWIMTFNRFVYNVTGLSVDDVGMPACYGLNVVSVGDGGCIKVVVFRNEDEFANTIIKYDGLYIIVKEQYYQDLWDEYKRKFNILYNHEKPYYAYRETGKRYLMDIDRNTETIVIKLCYRDGTCDKVGYDIPLNGGDKPNSVYDEYLDKYIQEEAPESVRSFMRIYNEVKEYLTSREEKAEYIKRTIDNFWSNLLMSGTKIAILSVTTKKPCVIKQFTMLESDTTEKIYNQFDINNIQTIIVSVDIKDYLKENAKYYAMRTDGKLMAKLEFKNLQQFIPELLKVTCGYNTIVVREVVNETGVYRLHF